MDLLFAAETLARCRYKRANNSQQSGAITAKQQRKTASEGQSAETVGFAIAPNNAW
jgi:hypothetical protein